MHKLNITNKIASADSKAPTKFPQYILQQTINNKGNTGKQICYLNENRPFLGNKSHLILPFCKTKKKKKG